MKKKLLSMFLTIIILLSTMSTVLATELNNYKDEIEFDNLLELIRDEEYINQQEIRINNELGIQPETNIELTNLFNYLKINDFLFVDELGHISIKVTAEEIEISQELFDRFLEDMDFLNENVDIGLIEINTENFKVKSNIENLEKDLKVRKDLLLEYNKFEKNADINMIEFDEMNELDIHQYRSIPEFDLVREVRYNYGILKNHYRKYVEIKNNYPDLDINPYGETVSYWIYQVKPRGEWDYKTREGFKPYNKMFLCTQFSGNKASRSSEYIGNYNYGYTGHFLFSLKTLRIGSFVVAIRGGESEFDLSNEYIDQMVIERAYDDAESTQR